MKRVTRARMQRAFGNCAVECRKTMCGRGKRKGYGPCMRTCLRKAGVSKRGRKG